MPLSEKEILQWLQETSEARIQELYDAADRVRREYVGDAVHFRGLIEVSNICYRQCGYCGIRASNHTLRRYRLTRDEILACVAQAVKLGYGTVVLQAGEDYGIEAEWMAEIIRTIKRDTPLAVTLSLGERTDEELQAWRKAGADRYLLRFETSDPELYTSIHPPAPGQTPNNHRLEQLVRLRDMGYEIGSGVMVGIPGQSMRSLARDIVLFRALNLDMLGVGPYLSHPETPLGSGSVRPLPPGEAQVSNAEEMTYRVVALTRMVCPEANIPATTALATLNATHGRELGLRRGANVIMPNLTPVCYRPYYEIYPGKVCIGETSEQHFEKLRQWVLAMGRSVGTGPGGRTRRV